MSEKTQKFGNVVVNKKEFHAFKQPIALNLIDGNKIVVSNKFKRSENGFKCFIGFKEGDIIRPLCIVLPQMSVYIKYFDDSGKNMSFKIENDDVFLKYNEIWNKIKMTLNIKFHNQPIYDEKYIKNKVKTFSDGINTASGNKTPKERSYYTCVAVICIDSVMKVDKKKLSLGLSRRVQI